MNVIILASVKDVFEKYTFKLTVRFLKDQWVNLRRFKTPADSLTAQVRNIIVPAAP